MEEFSWDALVLIEDEEATYDRLDSLYTKSLPAQGGAFGSIRAGTAQCCNLRSSRSRRCSDEAVIYEGPMRGDSSRPGEQLEHSAVSLSCEMFSENITIIVNYGNDSTPAYRRRTARRRVYRFFTHVSTGSSPSIGPVV